MMSRTTLVLARLAAACLALCLSGCLDYKEVLTLNAGGGGTLEAELTLDHGLLRELSTALREALGPDDLSAPTRAEFEGALRADGVRLNELHVEQQGSRTWARFRLDFDDLDALHRLEAFRGRRQLALFDHGQDRVLVVSRFDPRGVMPQADFGGPRDPEASATVAEVVARIRSGIQLESTLRLPGGVVATNGEVVQPGRDVRWSFEPGADVRLGQGEARMKVVCDASALPFATQLEPTPPEAGPVEADALAPVAVAATAATTAAPAIEVAGGGTRDRSSGCSLVAEPGRPGSAALLWAALCASLLFARVSRGQG